MSIKNDSAQLPHHFLQSGVFSGEHHKWVIDYAEAYAREALRAQAASVPVPFTFSPMWLAPLDGSPVMLYLPTTTDKFAVGIWHDGHGGGWGDDEGNYYVHEPVAFCSLANLERLTIRPAPQPQAVAASSPATAVDAVDENTLRAIFEVEMSDDGKWPNAIKRASGGVYLLMRTALAWEDWKSCAAALQASRQPQAQQAVAEGAGDEVARKDLPPFPWKARNLGGICEVLDSNGDIVIKWMGLDDGRKTFKKRRAITMFIANMTKGLPRG